MFKVYIEYPRYDDRDGLCGSSLFLFALACSEPGAVFFQRRAYSELGESVMDGAGVVVIDANGNPFYPLTPEKRKAVNEYRPLTSNEIPF